MVSQAQEDNSGAGAVGVGVAEAAGGAAEGEDSATSMEREAQEVGQGQGQEKENEMLTDISRNGAVTGSAGTEDRREGVGDGDDQEEEQQEEEVKGGCFVRIHNATTGRDLQVTTHFGSTVVARFRSFSGVAPLPSTAKRREKS